MKVAFLIPLLILLVRGLVQDGLVQLAAEQQASGAVAVTVKVQRAANTGVLLRVLHINDTVGSDADACDPAAPVALLLDLRDTTGLDNLLASPVLANGVWEITDTAAAAGRTYAAVLSPQRLREQFGSKIGYGAVAISGGSVAARVRACTFDIVAGTAPLAVSAAHVDIVARDAPAAGDSSLDATILSVTQISDTSTSIVLETTTAVTSPSASSVRGAPYPPVHIPEVPDAKCGDNSKDCTVSVAPLGTKTRLGSVLSECAATRQDANGNLACVQWWAVNVIAPALPALADVILHFGSQSVLQQQQEQYATPFNVHVVAPTVQQPLAKKSDGMSVAAFVRAEGQQTQRVGASSLRAGHSAGLLVEGVPTCIDLVVDDASASANDGVAVVKAVIMVCPHATPLSVVADLGVEECADSYNITLVVGSRPTNDFVRSARGSLAHSADGAAHLCFTPSQRFMGIIDILWSAAMAPSAKKPADKETKRDEGEDVVVIHLPPLAPEPVALVGNEAVRHGHVTFDTAVMCDRHDEWHGHDCYNADDGFVWSIIWTIAVVILILIIVAITIYACVGVYA